MSIFKSLLNVASVVRHGSTLDAARAGIQLGSAVSKAIANRSSSSVDELRTAAYAKQFTPVFVGRYIELARAGKSSAIPIEIRGQVNGFVTGRAVQGPDVNEYVYTMLYEHRARTGQDYPLP